MLQIKMSKWLNHVQYWYKTRLLHNTELFVYTNPHQTVLLLINYIIYKIIKLPKIPLFFGQRAPKITKHN